MGIDSCMVHLGTSTCRHGWGQQLRSLSIHNPQFLNMVRSKDLWEIPKV